MSFGTIVHESGHNYDYVNGNLSSSVEWKETVNADGTVSGYATRAYQACGTLKEDFAEAIMLFVTNLEELKNKYPKKYEYLINQFK